MIKFDSEVHECPVCKDKFLDIEGKYYMCPDCEQEYADFDALQYSTNEICRHETEFKLNQLYEVFFPTKEEMEAALDYYIRVKMSHKDVVEKCVEFCRQDPIWYYDFVVKEIKKRRNENESR